MKVLVIGSNGFIANNLINQLKKEHYVVGAYNFNKQNLCEDINHISIDKLDSLDSEFDQVYLLSAFIPVGQISNSERKSMFEANVELVDLVCKKYANSKIIYCSTVSVYNLKGAEIFESDNEGGLNEYGLSKMWGERIIRTTKNYSIVRLSSVYGTGMKLNTIIPTYISQAIKNNEIKIWGNGSRKQNYIHATDAVNFLISASVLGENDVFLGTACESVSNFQLAEIISNKTGCKVTFIGNDESSSFYYDNKYTQAKLDYKPSISLEEGIESLIKWIKEKY